MNATVVKAQWRQSRLVPMLLITIGAVLLGANIGLLPGDMPHALLHLWPAVLILVGVELLLGRSAPAFALALESVVVGLAVVLAAIAPDLLISGAPPGHEHLGDEDGVAIFASGESEELGDELQARVVNLRLLAVVAPKLTTLLPL